MATATVHHARWTGAKFEKGVSPDPESQESISDDIPVSVA